MKMDAATRAELDAFNEYWTARHATGFDSKKAIARAAFKAGHKAGIASVADELRDLARENQERACELNAERGCA